MDDSFVTVTHTTSLPSPTPVSIRDYAVQNYTDSSTVNTSLSDTGSEYAPNSNTSSDSSPVLPCSSDTKGKKHQKRKTARERNRQLQRSCRKKPARPCMFCGKFQTQLTRHLKIRHKNEDRVANALRLSKSLQVREFDRMRKEGIYKYNIQMLKEEKPLICERGNLEEGVKICTVCKAFIRRRFFFKHSKLCGARNGLSGTKGLAIELVDESDSIGFTELLSRFNDDKPGKLCKQNSVIKLVGKSQFNKHRRKKDKAVESRKAIMTKMRTLANLYFEFLACAKDDSLSVEDIFERKNFCALEEAIQNISTNEDGSLKPGLKVSIGNLLKLSAKVMKGTYLIGDDDMSAESIDKFVAVLQLRWASIFGDAEYQLLQNRNQSLRQPGQLPDEEAVKELRDYTVKNLKKMLEDEYLAPCSEVFITIRDLSISRLTLFNARRGGEPSRLSIKDWMDAQKEKWIDSQRAKDMNDHEKELLKTFKVIYQGGKGTNRLVPVLVPPDCVAALNFLSAENIRQDSRINMNNKFLFPSTKRSLDHASGWHSVKSVIEAAGIKTHITATTMRHRASTLYASLDIPEEQRKAFFRHMGHTEEMNQHVYQCPLGIEEVTKVGRYLASIDGLKVCGNNSLNRVTDHGNLLEHFAMDNAETAPIAPDMATSSTINRSQCQNLEQSEFCSPQSNLHDCITDHDISSERSPMDTVEPVMPTSCATNNSQPHNLKQSEFCLSQNNLPDCVTDHDISSQHPLMDSVETAIIDPDMATSCAANTSQPHNLEQSVPLSQSRDFPLEHSPMDIVETALGKGCNKQISRNKKNSGRQYVRWT